MMITELLTFAKTHKPCRLKICAFYDTYIQQRKKIIRKYIALVLILGKKNDSKLINKGEKVGSFLKKQKNKS